jgi:hypothetical protein
MIKISRLNHLYANATIPIHVKIVADDQFARARLLLRRLRERLENSQEIRIDELFSGVSHVFRELYVLPVGTSKNTRLKERIAELELNATDISKTLDGESQVILASLIEFIRNCITRKTSFDDEFYKFLNDPTSEGSASVTDANVRPALVILRKKKHKYFLESLLADMGLDESVDIRVPSEIKYIRNSYIQTLILGPLDMYENLSNLLANLVTFNIVNLSHFKPSDIRFGIFDNPIRKYQRDLILSRVNQESQSDISSLQQEALTHRSLETIDIDLRDLQRASQEGGVREDEIVPCVAMQFVDGRFVLFPAEDIERDEEKIDVLIDSEQDEERIVELLVSNLEEDSIVLLRDGETSKSAIIPEANRIMGAASAYHRSNQSLWKTELRKKLNLLGRDSVDGELRKLGIQRPYSYDWSRPDLIRPLSDQNFEILLDYLGLTVTQKAAVFDSSRVIKGAHVSAGRVITQTLKEAFSDVDTNEIYRTGSYSKSLGGDSNVRVTALVCEGFSDKEIMAPLSLTRRILENRGKLK